MEYGYLQAQTMDAFAQFCTPHFYNHHPTQRGTPGPAGWVEPGPLNHLRKPPAKHQLWAIYRSQKEASTQGA